MIRRPIRLDDLDASLADRGARRLEREPLSGAAVALVLTEGARETEILLIKRAERAGDPWSGHMAFPGGRRQEGDVDLLATSARETLEEVGIDLTRHGRPIGALDDIRAMSNLRPIDLLIRPFVYALTPKQPAKPDRREVEEAVWIPLSALQDGRARGVYRRSGNGVDGEFPALVYRTFTIWGLTYHMLLNLLELSA